MNTNFAVKEAVKNGVGVALISEYIAKMAEAGNEVKILHQAVEGERFLICFCLKTVYGIRY